MSQFRKLPVKIEARQLTGSDVLLDLAEWCGGQSLRRAVVILIDTLEGTMRAEPGDWIIKGVAGEFYPCKPDIFAATYEPAESTTEPTELTGALRIIATVRRCNDEPNTAATIDAAAEEIKRLTSLVDYLICQLDQPTTEETEVTTTYDDELTFAELTDVNRKLRRLDHGTPGANDPPEEIADTVIYLDLDDVRCLARLLAAYYAIDVGMPSLDPLSHRRA